MSHRFVKGIRYVPTLPPVLSQILALLNDERSSAQSLEKIITHDQALSSKVLAVANSAYYGFRHQIVTVARAVVALGYEEIRNICLGASLMGFLHPSSFRNQNAAELLWLHALTVAEAAAIVAEESQLVARDAAFTGGLLHDLGKVVLAAFFPDEVDALKDLIIKENLSYRAAEKALDLDHGQIGMALAEHWDLPPQIGEVMGYHHEPSTHLVYFPMVATVHLADFMARSLGLGHSGNPDRPEVKPVALSGLGLSREKMSLLKDQLNTRRLAVIGLWQAMIKG